MEVSCLGKNIKQSCNKITFLLHHLFNLLHYTGLISVDIEYLFILIPCWNFISMVFEYCSIFAVFCGISAEARYDYDARYS